MKQAMLLLYFKFQKDLLLIYIKYIYFIILFIYLKQVFMQYFIDLIIY